MAIVDVRPISLQPHYVPLGITPEQAAAQAAAAAQASAARQMALQQARIEAQIREGACRRVQCENRPVGMQAHCYKLCMQGIFMPRIAGEKWPPTINVGPKFWGESSTAGIGQLSEPLGVPLWGWALGAAGVGALIFFMRR